MFQRLKGFNLDSFLDSKIAEEQAKQAQTTSKSSPAGRRTPSNAPGNSRRSSARTDSPSKRTGSQRRAPDGEYDTPSKGPDPEDFVIGDDASDISRVATPMPVREGSGGPILEEKVGEKMDEAKAVEQDSSPAADTGKGKEKAADDQDLPEDVRKKLAKLESLTTKYQDLLRNYRTAHARVSAIEPFEATLREHTPLTSIIDPSAFVEFLNQRSVQSEMVMQELKRLSAENRDVVKERDDLKVKLDEAEKKAKVAFDEAAGLREQREAAATAIETAGKAEGASKETPAAASENAEDDTFFSYDSELPRLEEEALQHQAEIEKQTDYINELSTEIATLRSDLEVTSTTLEARRLDLNAMENKVSVKDRLIDGLQQRLDSATSARSQDQEDGETASASLVQSEARIMELQGQLKGYKANLEAKNRELTVKATVSEENRAAAEEKAATAEENLRKLKAEHEDNVKNGKYVQREEHMKKINQNIVATLKGEVAQAVQAKQIAEGRNKDLELEVNTLTSEANNRGAIITRLRGEEEAATSWKKKHDEVAATWKKKYGDADASWKKKLEVAEQERDTANRHAESKKGHEAAVASFRAQLKNATKERDQAYKMIIDCSRCTPAAREQARATLTSSLEPPTEDSTPAPRSRNSSEATEQTEVSTQPTEISTPASSADVGDPMANVETKKKNNNKKKKSKAKKKEPSAESAASSEGTVTGLTTNANASETVDPLALALVNRANAKGPLELPPSMAALAQDEDKAKQIISSVLSGEAGFFQALRNMERGQQGEQSSEDRMSDDLIEMVQAKNDAHVKTISQHESTIKEKDAEIEVLQGRIEGHEAAIETPEGRLTSQGALEEEILDLKEEMETLRESLLETGSESTDAKHALKERTEERDQLQQNLEECEEENRTLVQELKERKVTDDLRSEQLHEAQKQKETIEQELEEVRTTHSKTTAEASAIKEADVQAWQELTNKSREAYQALLASKEACEKQIEELKAQHDANSVELDTRRDELDVKYQSLNGEHNASKARVLELETELEASRARSAVLEADLSAANARIASLETDLAASQTLAQTRLKDNADLKEHISKMQPELKKLRLESEELKTLKVEVEKKGEQVKRLEGRERDLRSEIAEYKARAQNQDKELEGLRERAKTSDERATALEDTCNRTSKDLEANERTRDDAVEARDRVQAELKKVQDELKTTKASLDQLEVQVNKSRDEARTVREELQVKSEMFENAQSRMHSSEDEKRELLTQLKERTEQNQGLEEELADTQRLLSERAMEGQKMRRLVADAESRAEARVRAIQQRLDVAVEERDRAEDDASTAGRRKAREIEELKTKLRDAESGVTKATQARAEAERREREHQSREGDYKKISAQDQEELVEVRTAMAQLRDTLDENERHCEKEKGDLRTKHADLEARLEKLQKSGKAMAEELRSAQAMLKARQGSSVQSSRSSIDYSSSRVMSPVSRNGTPTGPQPAGGVDPVYLKHVLLQFLEQKEKKHQLGLVPVLGQLLHFDTQDTDKWKAAIEAR
ncbi:Golgin imh1 [Extremus antarcticus]|uniref:Golgin imh1 n=1 Tax=Extremus antarcticus TaxID=702011 RepID=A0AAJ0D904_9PEZI|nr:Golgin imh1 [Extremus antarcticus]